ncbi:alpha-galactosidase [Spirochaeta dissipatitropha]
MNSVGLIHYNEEVSVYSLSCGNFSYQLRIGEREDLIHCYVGPRLRGPTADGSTADAPFIRRRLPVPYACTSDPADPSSSSQVIPSEWPGSGAGDYRVPAWRIEYSDGSSSRSLSVTDHRIVDGLPGPEGLPSVRTASGDRSLVVKLQDDAREVEISLYYGVCSDHSALMRWSSVRNTGSSSIRIRQLSSFSLDLPDNDWHCLSLPGAWARERWLERLPLGRGSFTAESRRGISGHQMSPWMALAAPDTSQDTGSVLAATLLYSSSFRLQAECSDYFQTRFMGGIQPDGFCWLLQPGEEFDSPQAILSYTTGGLNGSSAVMQQLIRQRVVHPDWSERPRPPLLNSWEGLYFNTTQQTVSELSAAAADLDVELFVLDDGWFQGRNDDTSSLGDWYPDRQKFPEGIASAAEKVRSHGLKFGLWIEPEMVSPDSELYRKHPEWCLQVPHGKMLQSRNQLVLDLANPEVVDYLADLFIGLIGSASISYIKWDMNRNLAETGSTVFPPEQQGEITHRYMLGVYKLADRITSAYPDVLFEGCAGGGGRCDAGMLYYFPQYWTSDNTDALERMRIQYGSSMFLPLSSMSAHISAVPNHQLGRSSSMEFRAAAAMTGSFGLEFDARDLSGAELISLKQIIRRWRAYQPLLTSGTLSWILPPDWDSSSPVRPAAGNAAWSPMREAAWMVSRPFPGHSHSQESREPEALVVYVQILTAPAVPPRRLRIPGLTDNTLYRILLRYCMQPDSEEITEEWQSSGEDLRYRGIQMPYLHGDHRIVYIEISRLQTE